MLHNTLSLPCYITLSASCVTFLAGKPTTLLPRNFTINTRFVCLIIFSCSTCSWQSMTVISFRYCRHRRNVWWRSIIPHLILHLNIKLKIPSSSFHQNGRYVMFRIYVHVLSDSYLSTLDTLPTTHRQCSLTTISRLDGIFNVTVSPLFLTITALFPALLATLPPPCGNFSTLHTYKFNTAIVLNIWIQQLLVTS